MTKKRAMEILLAHSCCILGDKKICKECPWYNTEDCNSTTFTEVIEEAILTAKGFEIMNMKLDDIKITSAFAESVPSKKKMSECRWDWNNFHRQDRWIVVNQDGYLIDGYIQYLILKEHKEEYAEVKVSDRRKKRWYRKNTKDWTVPYYKNEPTTYIYGMHYNTNRGEFSKELVWRVPKSWSEQGWENGLKTGDDILVDTKYGIKKITVARVERLDKCPIDIPVRRVVKRLNKGTIDC